MAFRFLAGKGYYGHFGTLADLRPVGNFLHINNNKNKKKYKINFPKIIFIGRSPLPLYNVGGLGTDVSKNPLRWRGACAECPVTQVGAPTCFFAFFFEITINLKKI